MPVAVDYGLVDPDAIQWAAQQVIRQHDEPADPHRTTGRCAQCGEEGCRMLTWARLTLGIATSGAVQSPAVIWR